MIKSVIHLRRTKVLTISCPKCVSTVGLTHKIQTSDNHSDSNSKEQTDADAEAKYEHFSNESPPALEKLDWVNKPHPESNMRKIIYAKKVNNNEELDEKRMETYEWNNEFWKNHNNKFFAEKKKFIEDTRAASGSEMGVSDNLSEFYKDFLNKNHEQYMAYGAEWYRRNFRLLWMSYRTAFLSLIGRNK